MGGISKEDVNGESKSVGMKGEKSRSGVRRETGGYHQENLEKERTCESIDTWVESFIGQVRA